MEKHTHTHTECLWSAKMSASLGEAHMHFREVPLIQHEIQFKTWSSSRSPALIQRQIPTVNGELRLLSRAHVGVSAVVNTQVPQANKHMKNMLRRGCLVRFLFWFVRYYREVWRYFMAVYFYLYSAAFFKIDYH